MTVRGYAVNSKKNLQTIIKKNEEGGEAVVASRDKDF
jgi:hypothetical protein